MRVIGLISGTSADAIEAVLCDVEGAPPRLELRVAAARSDPLEAALRGSIHAVAAGEGDAESICLLDFELGERFARTALDVITDAGLRPDQVDLLGSPGHRRAPRRGEPGARVGPQPGKGDVL